MGKRGPKPQPASLKAAKGNPGRKRLPPKRAARKSTVPQPPSFLSTFAKREWKRLVPIFVELELIHNLDQAALAAYCVNWDRFRKAELNVKKNGELVPVGPNKVLQNNPWLNVSHRAQAEMAKFYSQFGLTPSARMGMNIDVGETRKPPKGKQPPKQAAIDRVMDKMKQTSITDPRRAQA